MFVTQGRGESSVQQRPRIGTMGEIARLAVACYMVLIVSRETAAIRPPTDVKTCQMSVRGSRVEFTRRLGGRCGHRVDKQLE